MILILIFKLNIVLVQIDPSLLSYRIKKILLMHSIIQYGNILRAANLQLGW